MISMFWEWDIQQQLILHDAEKSNSRSHLQLKLGKLKLDLNVYF